MTYTTSNYSVYAWDLASVTSTTTLFPDGSDGKSSPAGSSFTLADSATLTKITVSDNDDDFNDGDNSQDTTAPVLMDSTNHAAGDITPEYSYVVRPAGSNDPADNIIVYAIKMGNDVMGFASNEPMQPGQTYNVLSLKSNCPSVDYSDLATTALPPLETLDGIVDGTAGADLIDFNYTGDPDGDQIDHNDAILPGEAPQDDIVEAGAGNDTVYAGEGNDDVRAGAGDDLVFGEAGNDSLAGGDGADTLVGGIGADTLLGGEGDDNLSGGDDADLVLGNAGDDLIAGGAGDDTLFGDNASCASDPSNFFPEWDQAISNVVFYFDTDGDGIADYSAKVDGFPDSGSSKFISNDLDDYFGQMRDYLIANDDDLGPDSTVIGVSIKGGLQPSEYFQVDGNTNGVEPDVGSILNTGPGIDYEAFYNDFYTDYDPTVSGSSGGSDGAGNDTISGGEGNDVIFGEGGDDSISGDAGNDRLYGGSGNDSLSGGTGNDVIWGDTDASCPTPGNVAEPLTLSAGNVKYGSQTGCDGKAEAGDSVIYKNVTVTADGHTVMAKLILVDRSSGLNVDLTGGAGKEILLNGNNDASDAGKTASFRLEFYDQVTGLPISISSIATFGDLDKTAFAEMVGIPADQFSAYGLTGDTSLSLAAGSTITATGTEQNDPSDQDAWFSAAFENRGFINFTLTTREVNSGFTLNGAVIDQPVMVELHPGNDTIDGGEGDDTIYGEGGNDVLSGGAGADHIFGGDDRDVIYGKAGDVIDGNEGGDDYDTLIITDPASVVYDPANHENGTVYFAGGETLSFVNIENVVLDGGPLLDGIVSGTTGDDLIDFDYTGDPEGDLIDHNDAILPGEAPQDDIVKAGAGDDTVLAGLGNDHVYGEDGNDLLDGGAGDDFLSGGAGDDTFVGGAGNDSFQGNAGLDIIDYSASGAAVTVNLSTGFLAGGDAQGDVILGGVDGVIGSQYDDALTGFNHQGTDPSDTFTNHLFGMAGDDTLRGMRADDLLDGGAGNDDIVLENSFGNDTIVGGEADETRGDVLDATAVTDDLTLILSAPETGTISDGTGTANFVEIEEFLLGSGNDTVTGSSGADVVDGGAGNDVLLGGGGADTLAGGDDRDTFVVGSGADGTGDFIDGGEGGDDYDVLDLTGAGPLNVIYDPANSENGTVQFLDGDGNVTGTLSFVNIEKVVTDQGDGIVEGTGGDDLIDLAYLGDPEGDMIDHSDALLPGEAPQDDIVLAGDGNDTVYAGLGNDEVYGEAGDDVLYGESGDDYISGGYGDDVLYGGDGNDTLDAGQDRDTLYGGAGDDLLLGGSREDLLDGGDGDDTLLGGNAADTLVGGAGNDSLVGNQGNDSITGGDGNDYADGGDGHDYINTSGGGALPLPDLGYPGLFPADADPFNDRDTVFGGEGNDTILTGDDADWIDGGSGNDVIDAGFDNDTVGGGDGDDFIVGGEGSDSIDGGAGNDTIYGGLDPSFPDSLNIPDSIDLVHDNGRDTIHGGDGDDVIFGQDDDDVISGDAGDDWIDGGIDEDTITGGTGNDTIIGGEGADSMAGGDDRDTFLVGTNTAGLGDVVDGNEGGDDYDTLNLTGAGPLRVIYDTFNPENGIVEFLDGVGGPVKGTLTFTNIENVIPCFTPGTRVATPRGEMPVEELRAGDRVITRDNGIQEIRWVGKRALSRAELATAPHLRPVLIRAGSLGIGLPERDMLVSPNHRMLVANDRTALYFEEHEVLVAAKHLVDHKSVLPVEVLGTTYLHFMFDRHEVVLANGAWTESFQPGDMTLGGMGNAQRGEIFELFPELQTREGVDAYTSARRTLKRHEAALLGR